jgi:hypothetical protein
MHECGSYYGDFHCGDYVLGRSKPREKIVLRQPAPFRAALTLSLRVPAGRWGWIWRADERCWASEDRLYSEDQPGYKARETRNAP